MNLTVLRTYALQLEEVAKLELSELSQTLQQTVERMTMLDSQAREDADRYLLQVREGTQSVRSTLSSMPWIRPSPLAKDWNRLRPPNRCNGRAKRDELLEAMQYRKKLDLLGARAPGTTPSPGTAGSTVTR